MSLDPRHNSVVTGKRQHSLTAVTDTQQVNLHLQLNSKLSCAFPERQPVGGRSHSLNSKAGVNIPP